MATKKIMKILLISSWYKPSSGGAVKRVSRIAELLTKKHEVTVLTSLPSYPTGILPPEYRRKLWTKEKDKKVNIIRVWDFPAPNRGIFRRALNHLFFVISACLAVFFLDSFDIVIVTSPNFFSGLVGIFAVKIGRGQFVFDVRDLWPDSAIAMGFIKNNWLIGVLEALEKFYYRRANKILITTPGILRHLKKENVPQEKLVLLLNSVDTKIYRPLKVDRQKYGFKKNDFIVAYLGTHSKAQDLETTIKAAYHLKSYPRIKFLLVGEGEEKENLEKLSQNLNLRNIIFWPLKPAKEIISILNFADIGLASLGPQKIFQEAIPSKTLEYLACQKPVIASVGGDLKNYLERFQAGLVFTAGNPQNEAETILKLFQNLALRKKMANNARRLAIKIFSDQKFSQTLNEIFDQ